MSPQYKRLSTNHSLLADRLFLGVLACVYVGYLIVFGPSLYASLTGSSNTVVEHAVNTSSNIALAYWTKASMRAAVETDQQDSGAPAMTQASNTSAGNATQQEGQPPLNGNTEYPLSTVGKIFFTRSGLNMACSGTAVISSNRSVVDTAGHCLYMYGDWSENLIFCPLYDNGNTPYGCWAARDLEVPSDWINAKPNDYHHDMGMAIVAPNSEGYLTDLVGGAGWAYNQSANQPFYAYGYPAAGRFDGQTRQACDQGSTGTLWQHGDGTVISIPCDMTGGSSGGPWFIKIGNSWYLNGHNDFISSLQPGHMFSPYYDDTWYDLYTKAQDA